MTGTEPDIITNGGAVWLAGCEEWGRFESRAELDKFIDKLIEARDKEFPLTKEKPVESV